MKEKKMTKRQIMDELESLGELHHEMMGWSRDKLEDYLNRYKGAYELSMDDLYHRIMARVDHK